MKLIQVGTCVLTFGVLVLHVLTTFSTPMISSFYFLYASQAGGVRFGLWGWCLDEGAICISPLQLGFTWEPQISFPITKAFVLYPIAAVLTFITLICLIPVFCSRSVKSDSVFVAMALLSLFVSFSAFVFTIAIWNTAKLRFQRAGFDAQFGPLIWMSLAAVIILLIVSVSSGYTALEFRKEVLRREARRKARRARQSSRRHRTRRVP